MILSVWYVDVCLIETKAFQDIIQRASSLQRVMKQRIKKDVLVFYLHWWLELQKKSLDDEKISVTEWIIQYKRHTNLLVVLYLLTTYYFFSQTYCFQDQMTIYNTKDIIIEKRMCTARMLCVIRRNELFSVCLVF